MIHTHISLVRDENPANGIGSLGHLRVRKKDIKKVYWHLEGYWPRRRQTGRQGET
jgi:hypothetical protein